MKRKKLFKNNMIALAIILIVPIYMGITDYRQTTGAFEKPVFAQVINGEETSDNSKKYVGIGYSINIKEKFVSEGDPKNISYIRFSLFGKEVRYVISD